MRRQVVSAPGRVTRLIGALSLVLGICLGGGCTDHADNPGDASQAPAAQWFTEITTAVGLDFVHETGATGKLLLPEVACGGAALFDFDSDGDLDIYLINGNQFFSDAAVAQTPINRLYRQDPAGHFVDVTAESGLGDGGYGMGVAIGDIDNDGDADVYVTNYGPDRLYRNLGDGTFEDITESAGIDVPGFSCSAAFFDYDLDGFLDLYVTQYVEFDPDLHCFDQAGRRDYCGPLVFTPVHDLLLHNNGDPQEPGFTDVTEQAGVSSAAGAGLGVVCEDLNDDGWIDVYVANDGYANHLWLNQGDGTFREAALMMGVAYNLHGQPEAGMGVVAADFDNDTHVDLFMTHLAQETNTLYRNVGGGAGFTDITGRSGLGASSMTYTGFGTAALDVELDGDLDIIVVGGRVALGDPHPNSSVPAPWDRLAEPNLFFVNNGNARFEPVDRPVEALCGRVEVTRGLAIGDIDSDGDLDILISNVQGPARLYRNITPRKGHWLIVRAVDPSLRRDAIGARVTVLCNGQRQVRTIARGFSYLSSSDPRAHFGLGDINRVDRIEVRWPDGMRELFPATDVDRVVQVTRGTGKRQP
ncbi:MAG: CRTAC1 family protein [Planctomycetes bacterium]|nr:CRTAC1 family protein [Planctomycetota bacterium]